MLPFRSFSFGNLDSRSRSRFLDYFQHKNWKSQINFQGNNATRRASFTAYALSMHIMYDIFKLVLQLKRKMYKRLTKKRLSSAALAGGRRRRRKLLPMPTHAQLELKPKLKPKLNETQTETEAETETERSAARRRDMRKF